MNAKLILAFLTGAVIASGIVYVAVRPEQPKVAQHVASAPALPVVEPQALPRPPQPAPVPALEAAAATPQPVVVPEPVKSRPTVREKPSPLSPPPVRPYRPAVIASANVWRQPATGSDWNIRVNVRTPEPPTTLPDPGPIPAQVPQSTPLPVVQMPAALPPPQPEPDAHAPHSVTLAAGTILAVRIGETITSRSHYPGDTFLATLDQPLVIDGFIIAEKGARAEGRVIDSKQSGQNNNNSSRFEIELVKLATADGQHIPIHTESFQKSVRRTSGADAATIIGAGAAIGAAVGGAGAGGKGAAVGAGIGGAAGAAGVLLTRDRPAEIPVETRLIFRVKQSVTITEKLD